MQLDLYKVALEQALQRKVDKIYIYSVYLNKEIDITYKKCYNKICIKFTARESHIMAENKKIGKYDFIEYFDDANVYKVSVNNILS